MTNFAFMHSLSQACQGCFSENSYKFSSCKGRVGNQEPLLDCRGSLEVPWRTVCQGVAGKTDEQLTYHQRSSLFFIPQFKTKWISSRPGVTPAQFYEDVVLKLTEVVRSVRVDILNPINGTNIYKVRKRALFQLGIRFQSNKLNL